MFNKKVNVWLPGYEYDDGDLDHASSLVAQAVHVAGTIVLFDTETNRAHFGYWLRNGSAGGNAIAYSQIRHRTGTDGAGGTPRDQSWGFANPHGTTPARNIVRTTRIRAAGNPTNAWNAGKWLWYSSIAADNEIFDNIGSGRQDREAGWAKWHASFESDYTPHKLPPNSGGAGENYFGLWRDPPFTVSGNPATSDKLTFGSGLSFQTFKVDDTSDGEHVGYLPAIVIDNDDITNGWNPDGHSILDFDHSLVNVAYLFAGYGDFSDIVDHNLGPTTHRWIPRT